MQVGETGGKSILKQRVFKDSQEIRAQTGGQSKWQEEVVGGRGIKGERVLRMALRFEPA